MSNRQSQSQSQGSCFDGCQRVEFKHGSASIYCCRFRCGEDGTGYILVPANSSLILELEAGSVVDVAYYAHSRSHATVRKTVVKAIDAPGSGDHPGCYQVRLAELADGADDVPADLAVPAALL